jgi:hypothetical protein
MVPFISLVFLLTLLSSVVLGQDVSDDFQCGVIDVAQELNVDKNFDTVAPEPTCDWDWESHFLSPNTIHWHVYVIPDGDVPHISMTPTSIVEPYVSGSTLKFRMKNVLDGMHKQDRVQAAVNLYIPANQMKSIQISGVDQVVEIVHMVNDTEVESINIRDSGVDNQMYASLPYTKVYYKGSSVDSSTELQAASGSTVDISGVDQTLKIKTGDELKVKMSGVNQRVYIDGDYTDISMSGVDNKVYVNGPSRCDHISKSGVDNNCQVTEDTVTVRQVECLANTKVGYYRCGWNSLSTGATVGLSVGAVTLFILCCVAGGCGIRACCRQRQGSNFPPPTKDVEAPKVPPDQSPVAIVTGEPKPPTQSYYPQSSPQVDPNNPPIVHVQVL